MRLFKLTIVLLLLPLCIYAQKTEVGVFGGIINYQGDFVGPDISLKSSGLAFGVLAKHHINSKIAVRASLNFGKIKGDDANFEDNARRNFSFESPMFDLTGAIEYSFLTKNRYDDGGTFKRGFSPFVYVGIGIINANPDVTVPENSHVMLTQEELDASNLHLSVPIGVGLKFDLNERSTLAGEASLRATFSDYLDGLSEAGGPDKDDWYYMVGLTYTYRLGEMNKTSVGNN